MLSTNALLRNTNAVLAASKVTGRQRNVKRV